MKPINPKDYDSHNIYKDEDVEINILVKKSFFERHFWKLFIAFNILMILYKVAIGDFNF